MRRYLRKPIATWPKCIIPITLKPPMSVSSSRSQKLMQFCEIPTSALSMIRNIGGWGRGRFIHSRPTRTSGLMRRTPLQTRKFTKRFCFFLYKRRREHPEDPGVLSYHVQGLTKCSDESFEFHTWYLKSKGYLEITQQSELAITIEGVDHVIAMSRSREERKLLTKDDEFHPKWRAGD